MILGEIHYRNFVFFHRYEYVRQHPVYSWSPAFGSVPIKKGENGTAVLAHSYAYVYEREGTIS